VENRPPSPPSLGPLGHLPPFLSNTLPYLERCRRSYGKVVALNIGGPALLITSPEDVEHVLLDSDRQYGKSPRIVGPAGRKLWGKSVIASEGESHRCRRIALAPLFSQDALQDYLSLWQDALIEAVPRWTLPGPLRPLLSRLTRAGILHILLGRSPENELVDLLEKRGRWIARSVRGVWAGADPSGPLRGAFRQALDEPSGRGLIDCWKKRGLPGETEEAMSEFLTFAVAGYETTLEALEWSLWLLAEHPQTQESLRQGRLAYSSFLREVLRLYPPTWLFVRVARGHDRLPSGYTVAKGTKIYLCQYLSQRDPDLWENPQQFQPDRSEHRLRFASFPFGGGRRRCLSSGLATAQIETFLDYFLKSFHFHVYGTADQRPRAQMTLRPAKENFLWAVPKEPMSPGLSFSIVVPTYDRPESLKSLLRALRNQDYPGDLVEVIVTDDAGSQPLDLSEFEGELQMQVVRLARNSGCGPARQEAIEKARHDYLAFLDDDCVPAPNWLLEMSRTLRRNPEAGVGGLTLNGLADNRWSQTSQFIMDQLHHYFNRSGAAEYFATNNLVLSREQFFEIGGLPKDWCLAGGEDRALCARWRQRYQLKFAPDAVVFHYHRLGLDSFWRQHYHYGRGGRRFTREGGRRVRLGNGFFRRLVAHSLRQGGPGLLARVALAQAATFCGYLRERLSEGQAPAVRKPGPYE